MTTKPDFKCERCDEVFTSKHNLLKHLGKKFVCTPIDIDHTIDTQTLIHKLTSKPKTRFNCSLCNTSFATNQTLKRHSLICKSNGIVEEIPTTLSEPIVVANTLMVVDAIPSEDKLIGFESFSNHSDVVAQTTLNFGNENMSHITHQFLDSCLFTFERGIKNLLKEIYCNSAVPENHNIRSHNTFEVYSQNNWSSCDKNKTIAKMIQNGCRILFKHFLDNHIDANTYQHEQQNKLIIDYLSSIMKTTGNYYKELHNDLCLIF